MVARRLVYFPPSRCVSLRSGSANRRREEGGEFLRGQSADCRGGPSVEGSRAGAATAKSWSGGSACAQPARTGRQTSAKSSAQSCCGSDPAERAHRSVAECWRHLVCERASGENGKIVEAPAGEIVDGDSDSKSVNRCYGLVWRSRRASKQHFGGAVARHQPRLRSRDRARSPGRLRPAGRGHPGSDTRGPSQTNSEAEVSRVGRVD